MHAAQDVPQRDLGRRASQQVPAFLASLASDDALGLELNENLNQIVRRDPLFRRQILDTHGDIFLKMPRQTHDGTSGIITFHGEFHERKIIADERTRNTIHLLGASDLGLPIDRLGNDQTRMTNDERRTKLESLKRECVPSGDKIKGAPEDQENGFVAIQSPFSAVFH